MHIYCNYKIDDIKAVERNKRCPVCGDFMMKRQSKDDNFFYGCHGYPYCNHTEEIGKDNPNKKNRKFKFYN